MVLYFPWSCMGCLQLTKIELEIPTDYDMILMIKAGTRGGVSSIMHRHSVANNKYMASLPVANGVSGSAITIQEYVKRHKGAGIKLI